MAEFLSKAECHICNKSVDAKTDKNGKVYYACGHCGTRVFYGQTPSEFYKSKIEEAKNDRVQSIRTEKQQSGTTERRAGEDDAGNGTTGTTTERAREPENDGGIFSNW